MKFQAGAVEWRQSYLAYHLTEKEGRKEGSMEGGRERDGKGRNLSTFETKRIRFKDLQARLLRKENIS